MTKDKNYFIVNTKLKQKAVLEYLKAENRGLIALDTETTSSNSIDCELMGISVSVAPNEAFYFIVNEYKGEKLIPIQEERLFQLRTGLIDLLEKSNIKIIMHNSVFDVLVMRNTMGIDCLPNLHADTILMKHTVNESKPHGLKDVATNYLKVDWKEAQKELKKSVVANGGKWLKSQKDMYMADTAVLGKYACADADMTGRLYDVFVKELDKQGLSKFYFKDEVHPLNKVVIDGMVGRGISCDISYFKELKRDLEAEARRLEKEAHENLDSKYAKHYEGLELELLEKEYPLLKNGALFEQLYLDKGLEIVHNKKTKRPTFAKTVIESVASDNPNESLLQWKLGELSDKEFIKKESGAIYGARRKLFKEKYNKEYVINLCSNDQLKNILFKRLGEKPLKTTDKNNAQVDEYVLEHFAKKYDFVDKLLKLRKINKLLSTYVEAVLTKNINGIIHPDWLQFGTDSGRFACQNPNFQNLPRDDDRIKKGIVARDGYVLIGPDYSQLEPRVFAHCSGEKNLIDAYRRGDDFYGTIAVDVFDLDCAPNEVKKKYPDERQKAKTIGLGLAYGMRKWKLGGLLGVTPAKAQKYIDKYWKTYPSLFRFVNRSQGEALKYGFVQTQAGRKRRFRDIKTLKASRIKKDKMIYNKLLNLSINFKIQSLAASIVNRAMIKMYEEFKKRKLDAHVLVQIHDEIVVEAKEEQAQEIMELMKDIMENNYKLSVPLVVEPKIVKRLSETK